MTPEPRTVMIVEDDPATRTLLRQVLARCPCQVLEAASGAEAIATFERHPGLVPLLVVDLNRAGMTGPELAARGRALRPGVCVLNLSGSRLLFRCLGNDELILTKPVRLPELVDKVLALLPGSVAVHQG
jgi:CheY-like chemotaxis protein